MNRMTRGLILAGIQLAIVAGLGAKLAFDRARLPRAWGQKCGHMIRVCQFGDDIFLCSLLCLCNRQPDNWVAGGPDTRIHAISRLVWFRWMENCRQLKAESKRGFWCRVAAGLPTDAMIIEPVVFFLPERADHPLRMARGGELWAEVTIPKKGPPRPIRLAVKNGGRFTPLEVK